jgi:hypothetical protein
MKGYVKTTQESENGLHGPLSGIFLAKYAKGCTKAKHAKGRARPGQKMRQMPKVLEYPKAPTRGDDFDCKIMAIAQSGTNIVGASSSW